MIFAKFMKRKKTKKQKGFLLVEAIVYIFVMSLLLVVILGSAGGYLKNRFSLKKDQQDIEEMSLAINELAKKIRMSNSTDDSVDYEFEAKKLTVSLNEKKGLSLNASFDDDKNEFLCFTEDDSNGVNGVVELIKLDNVTGSFYYKKVDDDGDGIVDGIPLITIQIQKVGKPQTKMQTSVSQRGGYTVD